MMWNLPDSQEKTDTKIGKQMPPHHEPDAVLINNNGKGQPRMPEGNFPQFPGIFGFPRPGGGGPGVNRPGYFPGIFGAFPGNRGMQGVPGIPNDPSVFIPRGQGGPLMPNGPNVYGVQGGPGFTVRTGYFIPNGQPSYAGEPHIFGQPGVFAIAGSGNVPFPTGRDFFSTGRGSTTPQSKNNFPSVRGMAPEPPVTRRNGFQPEGVLPSGLHPEAPLIPNQPGFNSNSNFPRQEFYGGAGGREIYDDPIAESFPLVEASFPYYVTI